MLRLLVCVSGGGTNLQAIFDAIDAGKIRNAEIAAVISNNPGAYALERARQQMWKQSVFLRNLSRAERRSIMP